MSVTTAKGSTWESAIVKWLKPRFPFVERRRLAGRNDRGDIAGLANVVIEAKSISGKHLVDVMSTGLKELQTEVDNANAELGLLCIKRPGFTSPGNAYWVIDPRHVQTVIELIDTAGRLAIQSGNPGPNKRNVNIAPLRINGENPSTTAQSPSSYY